jgi:hypothetical protein
MYDITYHGLNCWSNNLFEKLGWMVLAYDKGHKDVTDCYIVNIENLHKAIIEKIKETIDQDKKNDLEIMKRNVEVLLKHCKKDFTKNNKKNRKNNN